MLERLEQVQTLDTPENNKLFTCFSGMNGAVRFDVKSGVMKKEPLTGILHNLQRYQYQANNGTGL